MAARSLVPGLWSWPAADLCSIVIPSAPARRHYMCFLYLGRRMLEELNFFRDPHFGVPLEAIWSDEQVSVPVSRV